MAKGTQRQRRRSRLSLSVRFSLLMLLAALLPLVAVVGVNDYFARQSLIKQSSDALRANASSTASQINDYLSERMLDGVALSSLDTAPEFLACVPQVAAAKKAAAQGQLPQISQDCATNFQAYGESVGRALFVGTKRDANYTLWNMYDPKGDLLLSSDQNVMKTGLTVPAEDLKPAQAGHQWISGVYYDAQHQYAYVRLYTPIYQKFPNQGAVLGFLQATLKLDKVWSIVNLGTKANGAGSVGFVTDQNGIRIADTDGTQLFTAVQPLDAQAQSLIVSEQRFGTSNAPQIQSLPDVASALAAQSAQSSFQTAEPGANGQFQFVGQRLSLLPWMYFTASPLTTVTAVATQQVKYSLISAAVVAVLAMLLGLWIGSRTARPVERSVENLEGAAQVLKALASRQENSASEQHWVVDACKTGLDGVRYLADAMNQAAKRILNASNWFNDYWDRLTEEQARATVQHLRELAAYIDEAARRQQASSDRLDKAITVTMQVSDQLLTGATEATESASQLEGVVRDLQRVVGGSFSGKAGDSDDDEQIQRRMDAVTGSIAVPRLALNASADGGVGPQGFSTPARPASGRVAPRAPRQPWDSPSQMGGEDWDAFAGQIGGGQMGGGQTGSQMGGQMGSMSDLGQGAAVRGGGRWPAGGASPMNDYGRMGGQGGQGGQADPSANNRGGW